MWEKRVQMEVSFLNNHNTIVQRMTLTLTDQFQNGLKPYIFDLVAKKTFGSIGIIMFQMNSRLDGNDPESSMGGRHFEIPSKAVPGP